VAIFNQTEAAATKRLYYRLTELIHDPASPPESIPLLRQLAIRAREELVSWNVQQVQRQEQPK
jgi:hypothetical protein